MGQLSEQQKHKLKTEGAEKYKKGQTTIRKLAQEYNCSTPTIMWHLGYRSPSKKASQSEAKGSVYPRRDVIRRPNGNTQIVATPAPNTFATIDTKDFNRATVIMGTPEQIAEILRGLK